MRKLYNEFFHIPKHGEIREKVMLTRICSTVATIVMCLTAMSITAYAYFSYNITSGSNTIKAATFKTEVQVRIFDSDGEAADTVTPITSDHQSFRIEGLTVGKTYTVTLKPIHDETTAKTGFVVVTADNCPDTYHTQQLGKDESVEGGETEELSFKLTITGTTNVLLTAHWGTSSYYDEYKNKGDAEELYITQNEEIEMNVTGAADTPASSTGNKNDSTAAQGSATTDSATETAAPSTTTPETTSAEASGTSKTEDITESTQETVGTTGSTEQPTTEPASTEATTSTETQSATETATAVTGATTTAASSGINCGQKDTPPTR